MSKGTIGNALLPPHRRDDGHGSVEPFQAYLDLVRKLTTLRLQHPRKHGKEEQLLHALDRIWEALDNFERLEVEKTLRTLYADRFEP